MVLYIISAFHVILRSFSHLEISEEMACLTVLDVSKVLALQCMPSQLLILIYLGVGKSDVSDVTSIDGGLRCATARAQCLHFLWTQPG